MPSQKGYGFLNSDEVQGDVHFTRTELPDDAREIHRCLLLRASAPKKSWGGVRRRAT